MRCGAVWCGVVCECTRTGRRGEGGARSVGCKEYSLPLNELVNVAAAVLQTAVTVWAH